VRPAGPAQLHLDSSHIEDDTVEPRGSLQRQLPLPLAQVMALGTLLKTFMGAMLPAA